MGTTRNNRTYCYVQAQGTWMVDNINVQWDVAGSPGRYGGAVVNVGEYLWGKRNFIGFGGDYLRIDKQDMARIDELIAERVGKPSSEVPGIAAKMKECIEWCTQYVGIYPLWGACLDDGLKRWGLNHIEFRLMFPNANSWESVVMAAHQRWGSH